MQPNRPKGHRKEYTLHIAVTSIIGRKLHRNVTRRYIQNKRTPLFSFESIMLSFVACLRLFIAASIIGTKTGDPKSLGEP